MIRFLTFFCFALVGWMTVLAILVNPLFWVAAGAAFVAAVNLHTILEANS